MKCFINTYIYSEQMAYILTTSNEQMVDISFGSETTLMDCTIGHEP